MKRSGTLFSLFAVLVVCTSVAACAGGGDDDDDDDDGGNPTPTPTPCADPADFTLSTIQDEIFTPRCATLGCHDSATTLNNMLDLSEGATFGETVGETAQGDFSGTGGADILVVTSDASASYLMRKVNGQTGIEGTRMPQPPEPALCQADKDAIAAWIEAGADDN